jgi:hypothetical protein
MSSLFILNAYLLDPDKPAAVKVNGSKVLKPQVLSETAQGLGSNPFNGLLQIREIKAQRGFADASNPKASSDDDTEDRSSSLIYDTSSANLQAPILLPHRMLPIYPVYLEPMTKQQGLQHGIYVQPTVICSLLTGRS